MDTDPETVQQDPAEAMDEVIAEADEQLDQPVEEQVEEMKEERVPLSALQKERRKRQEAEKRAKLYEEMQERMLHERPQQEVQEEDLYEAATKADLHQMQNEAIRAVEERSWVRSNPDKAEEVNENLEKLLKSRPHLKAAIEGAPNRYEEAWVLMNALSPKQKAQLKAPPQQPKKTTPGAPGAVPKGAGINQTIDVMQMSDEEFAKWRTAQRRR